MLVQEENRTIWFRSKSRFGTRTFVVDPRHSTETLLPGHIPEGQVNGHVLFEANGFGEKVNANLRERNRSGRGVNGKSKLKVKIESLKLWNCLNFKRQVQWVQPTEFKLWTSKSHDETLIQWDSLLLYSMTHTETDFTNKRQFSSHLPYRYCKRYGRRYSRRYTYQHCWFSKRSRKCHHRLNRSHWVLIAQFSEFIESIRS